MDDKTQRAIAHLAEALYLLACVRNPGDHATVPIRIGENQIDVTPKTAEALADAVDSMNAYMATEAVEDDKLRAACQQVEAVIDIDEDRMTRATARFMGWLEGQAGEAIASGVWSADAVAQNDPGTCAEVTDTFNEIDLTQLHKEVCKDRQVDEKAVTQALDDWFGDIEDPELVALYGDEDDV